MSHSDSSDEEDMTKEIDVCHDGGVKKLILKRGTGQETPKKGTEVSVHYVGTLLDGTKFDSSRDRNEEFKFTIGSGVIKGWSKCVATMKRGELCKVTLTPEYAYGETGSGDKIPPNSTLVFEIELLSFSNLTDVSKKKDGSILKQIIDEAEGSDWKKPKFETRCSVKVKCSWKDSPVEEFDGDIILGEPLSSQVTQTKGFKVALKSMKKGETARFEVKAPYCTAPPTSKIPANQDLVYEIALKDFEQAPEPWGLDWDKKKDEAERRKKNGKRVFWQRRIFSCI